MLTRQRKATRCWQVKKCERLEGTQPVSTSEARNDTHSDGRNPYCACGYTNAIGVANRLTGERFVNVYLRDHGPPGGEAAGTPTWYRRRKETGKLHAAAALNPTVNF